MTSGDGLFDPSRLDLVGVAADGTVELFIVQDRRWSGSDEELGSLQAKVQSYVAYALDGAMLADYPETEGHPWQIVVHAQTNPPDARILEVIRLIDERLVSHGGRMVIRTD